MKRDPERDYERYRAIVHDEPLPCALIDLDALERNTERLVAPVRARGKALRLATKSLRCPALIERLISKGGGTIRGIMAYAVREAEFLVELGHREIIVAYPTVQRADLDLAVKLNQSAEVVLMV